MPDDYGPVYEGLIAAAAERRGLELLPTTRQQPSCRVSCLYSKACSKTHTDVALDVDPDLIVRRGTLGVIVYVTHWRTADSFQKKFWRTMEELFQYRMYKPEYRHMNWVFEPLQIKAGLLSLMRQCFDWSIDYNTDASASLSDFMRDLPKIAQRLEPLSQEKAKEYFLAGRCSASSKAALADVEQRLGETLMSEPRSVSSAWAIMASQCLSARQRGQLPRIIRSRIRTPVQLGTIVAASASEYGVPLDFERLFTDGETRSKNEEFIASVTSIPVRKKGDKFALLGTRFIGGFRLNKALFEAGVRLEGSSSLSDLTLAYFDALRNSEVWGPYLKSIVATRALQTDLSSFCRNGANPLIDVTGIVQEALTKRQKAWMLEVALCALGFNLNDLNRDLDPVLISKHGVALKEIAPFGDSGIHVIGNLNTGNWDDLKPIPGTSIPDTFSILRSEILAWVNRISVDGLVAGSRDTLILSYRYKRIKTFLSRAPHPLRPALLNTLKVKGFEVLENYPVPNFLNQMAGGKTGRFEVDFLAKQNGKTLLINIVTAQDGNESHKRKEMAARIKAARVHFAKSTQQYSAIAPRIWLILDGDWQQSFVRNLYESGAEAIFPALEWDQLVRALDQAT
jgi:hypothetical protein